MKTNNNSARKIFLNHSSYLKADNSTVSLDPVWERHERRAVHKADGHVGGRVELSAAVPGQVLDDGNLLQARAGGEVLIRLKNNVIADEF